MSTHDETRAGIAREAIRLFFRRGYDETTVDDIASAAGISRRTYFRYFASKDETLFLGLQEVGYLVADAARRQPPQEPPLKAILNGFIEVMPFYEEQPHLTRALAWLLRSNPRLRGSMLLTHSEYADAFTEVVAQRRGHSTDEVLDRLTAEIAMDAWEIAVQRWLPDPSLTLSRATAEVFAEVERMVSEPAQFTNTH